MVLAKYLFVFYCLLLVTVNLAYRDNEAIDYDYFFGSSAQMLRAHEYKMNCEYTLSQVNCRLKCKGSTALCFDNKCYCVYDISKVKQSEELKESSSPVDSPLLRHHIAHFCENLDTARDCITKCMKKGKPAFCGKDHVCYCGHKGHMKDKVNVTDMYSQFRDLYEKYFGPNIFDSLEKTKEFKQGKKGDISVEVHHSENGKLE